MIAFRETAFCLALGTALLAAAEGRGWLFALALVLAAAQGAVLLFKKPCR